MKFVWEVGYPPFNLGARWYLGGTGRVAFCLNGVQLGILGMWSTIRPRAYELGGEASMVLVTTLEWIHEKNLRIYLEWGIITGNIRILDNGDIG